MDNWHVTLSTKTQGLGLDSFQDQLGLSWPPIAWQAFAACVYHHVDSSLGLDLIH